METPNNVPANEVQPVVTVPETPVTSPAGGETVESLRQQLESERQQRELEQAKRIIAESEATNAKKDIIAIKTGRKREEVDLAQQPAPTAQPAPIQTAPTAVPTTEAALAAALAEQQRITAELLRSARPGLAAPTGGGGFAESPAPKPQGYWSEAQRNELKKRGWGDEKIARAEKMARDRAGLSEVKAEAYGYNPARRY